MPKPGDNGFLTKEENRHLQPNMAVYQATRTSAKYISFPLNAICEEAYTGNQI